MPSSKNAFVSRAAGARAERLLATDGAVFEVLVLDGISQRFAARTRFESLEKEEAERLFAQSAPHSRVCIVTRRQRTGEDLPSWYLLHLPRTRWHGLALDEWVRQLHPSIQPSVVCGSELLERTSDGWGLPVHATYGTDVLWEPPAKSKRCCAWMPCST